MRQKFRVLVVDDFDEWRRFVGSKLHQEPRVEIVGEASDGLEALEKTKKFQPDLIVLDVGLPKLNGIEVARRILRSSPNTRIIFLSENRSDEIAEAALSTGAAAYVIKSDAGTDLMPAMEAVFQGGQ